LPPIRWNARLLTSDGAVLPTPDGFIPDAALALEVDSREHHAGEDGWRRTLRRSNVLEQYGIAVLHFTPTEIRLSPAAVRRTVEQTCTLRLAGCAAAAATATCK
jgi:very-short-patch-repair endonuclease